MGFKPSSKGHPGNKGPPKVRREILNMITLKNLQGHCKCSNLQDLGLFLKGIACSFQISKFFFQKQGFGPKTAKTTRFCLKRTSSDKRGQGFGDCGSGGTWGLQGLYGAWRARGKKGTSRARYLLVACGPKGPVEVCW